MALPRKWDNKTPLPGAGVRCARHGNILDGTKDPIAIIRHLNKFQLVGDVQTRDQLVKVRISARAVLSQCPVQLEMRVTRLQNFSQ